MKKVFSLILVFMLVLPLVGCADPFLDNATLPPTRIGECTNFEVNWVKETVFEDVFAECTAVARVQIGSWLGENSESHVSYFEARVLECLEGKLPKTFVLRQPFAGSKLTHKKVPVFTAGNELLVFIGKATEDSEYGDTYYMVGSYLAFLDVVYDDKGNRFFADRIGNIGDSIDITYNYLWDTDFYYELLENAKEADPILEEINVFYDYVYSEADFKTFLKNQQK